MTIDEKLDAILVQLGEIRKILDAAAQEPATVNLTLCGHTIGKYMLDAVATDRCKAATEVRRP